MQAAKLLCRRRLLLLLLVLLPLLAYRCCAASYAKFPLPACQLPAGNAIGNTTTVFLSAGRFVFGCELWDSPAAFYLTVAFNYNVYRGTPVWTANSARPVSPKASLDLTSAGDVLLHDADLSVVWRANAHGVVGIALNKSGNLLLLNSSNSTVWQSFDHPVDILLPSQILRPGTLLEAGFSSPLLSSSSTSSFSAVMEPGGLALFVKFPGSPSLPYYVFGFNLSDPDNLDEVLHGPCNNTVIGEISPDRFALVLEPASRQCNSSGSIHEFRSLQENVTVDYLRLESDGNIRGYQFENPTWNKVFDWFSNCSLPGVCGPYGVCSSSASKGNGQCSCPRSNSTSNQSLDGIFEPISNSDPTKGCAPPRPLNCSLGEGSQYFLELEGADYFANDFFSQNVSVRTKEDCKNSCASNCSCAAAFYRTDSRACFHYETVLSIMQSSELGYLAFLKVQNISVPPRAVGGPSGDGAGSDVTVTSSGRRSRRVLIVGITVGGTGALIFCLCVSCLCVRCKSKQRFGHMAMDEDDHLGTLPGQPIRFTFKELQQATLEFNCKLGVGGFGSVYKGTLSDGSSVAVKQLESARQGYKEFRAEVMALGNVNHQNLVRLRGFCAEGPHRLLVYEYMSNGSLDAWIFHRPKEAPVPFLDWNSRFQIAVDVARGLVFLHEESRENIIHLDIKPQNILLDDKFAAKLSDFGLSKLMDQDENRVITHMRGTPGYMAPEWLLHMSATEKSDVYSFGMVLLEILSGRKNVDLSKQRESWYFPALAVQRYGEGREREVMDEKLDGTVDENQFKQARRMMQTAFWCIQEDPSSRPAMVKALLMLEGHKEVPEPPLSLLQSGGAAVRSHHHHQNSRQFHEISFGSSSPGYRNVSTSSARSSMNIVWNGGGQLDDCSLLLSPRE